MFRSKGKKTKLPSKIPGKVTKASEDRHRRVEPKVPSASRSIQEKENTDSSNLLGAELRSLPPPEQYVHQDRSPGAETTMSAPPEERNSIERELVYVTAKSRQGNHTGHHGRRQVPRRHTVTASKTDQHAMGYRSEGEEEPDRKREQFMAVLAQRYPQYADRISGSQYSGSGSESGYPIQQQPRQRDHQRRRTTIVTYNPDHNRSMEYDSGTMSDVDLPPSSFQRGGFTRSSLPIVRSSSSTFDRPIGLVFLIFRDETKKALLPNEITSLDTVRALFVRSFPEKLSMEFLDSPKRKIYVLEPKSNIYFQLEDLRDIKDRSLLKIHECESIEPQRVKEYPPALRGRSVQAKSQQAPPKPARDLDAVVREEYAKTRSLPAQLTNHYQEIIDDQRMWEVERRSRSHTPEVDRPRSLSVGPARTRASPERLPTPERAMLRTIPEHQQMRNGYPPSVNGGSNGNYETLPAYQRDLRGQAASPTGPPPHRPFSPPGTSSHYEPVYGYHQQPGAPQPPQTYVAHSVRAHTVHAPQRATVPPVELRNGTRNNNQNRHSLTFAPMSGAQGQGQGQVPNQEPPYQRSQSYRVTPERDTVVPRARSLTPQPSDSDTKYNEPMSSLRYRNRIDKMEAQLASLTAWVHNTVKADSRSNSLERNGGHSSSAVSTSDSSETFPGSTASTYNTERKVTVTGMSDIPTASSQSGTLTGSELRDSDLRDSILNIRQKACELKGELRGLRRMQQINKEDMMDTIQKTIVQLKDVLRTIPGASSQVVRRQRSETDSDRHTYIEDKAKIAKELTDLESSVEELRADVISRQCRVNMSDVEGMALILSNVTKSLADLKARYPALQEQLKLVMAGEMEIVVQEEKFVYSRFLKEEPEKLEIDLKRCKKLTGTLYTLKRLASVQEHRPPQIPPIASNLKEVGDEDRKTVLENIRAIVPNHDSRVAKIEAAETSRERKKKISTKQEALKMGKSLELASRALRPASESDGDVDFRDSVDCGPRSAPPHASMPLTETTEKISNVGMKCESDAKNTTDKYAARAAFFGDMSPPKSPEKEVNPSRMTMDYTVRIPSSSLTSGGGSKPNNLNDTYILKSDISPTRSQLSIPRVSGKSSSQPTSPSSKKGESSDGKQRKVPPPPPPRKSSRLPTASISSSSNTTNGNVVSPVHTVSVISPSPDESEDKTKNAIYHEGQGRGPVSSTPKPTPPKKPTSKFEKDLVAGIYANMNRPDLQSQKVAPERIINKASVEEGKRLSREERGSSSESTSSSASLDSQQGGVVMRRTSADVVRRESTGERKVKPPPPERRSSLLQKKATSPSDEKILAQQRIQEEQKKLEELVRETNEMMKRQSTIQTTEKTNMNGINSKAGDRKSGVNR
ncbi:sickle tail protein homolog isoform X6 [Haliotis rufescens]|uniref:sickle tail protein homolog isoform X6 n=1 Tax=Haliotis rufescens TaxID=6454 RepID=UPI001EAFBAE7|nr:sickle tail protein homolog isoform X6 [Haliotis rufescens]